MSVRNSLRSYVEDLFSKNTDYKYPEQAINQAESLKSLSSDLYTDNIRFIYELIQNADDAQAVHVVLTILDEKYLIIGHDGKVFDEKDLQGLCGVNNGTKKKDLNKTGYKGLGFKAVFGKSDKVIVYSNGEYVRFDGSYQIKWNKQWGTTNQQTWEHENDRQFIYPWQINPIWTDKNDVPYLIRNFLRSKQIHVANIILLNNVEEIRSTIHQLKQQPYMFLFLRNISELNFITQSIDTISIARAMNDGMKSVYVNQKIVSQWIIKRYELDVPGDVRDKLAQDSKAPEKLRWSQKAEMFFAAKYKDGGEIEKLHDKESHLFSYLPTKIFDYTFPIIINANFLTNANREQIHTDSAWNQWLFDRIGIKLFEWIQELVMNDQFHYQAYKLLPAKLTLTNNNLSNEFNTAFDWSIQYCPFIRNRENELLTINQVIMDLTSMSEQTSFINTDSMHQYTVDQYNRGHFQCAEHPFIDYDSNLARIGVPRFTWQNCIDMFKSDQFLQAFSIEENQRMIVYFYSTCPNSQKADEVGIPIEQIPFLLDQNGDLQSVANIYFPAETVGDSGTSESVHSFVHKDIFHWLNKSKQAGVKEWLKDLGVNERTDLTYLWKTIIPHASTYITLENAVETIRMLFILFQKHEIEKAELNQLKKLKLLTIQGTLIAAERCFFSKMYHPRLAIEKFLAPMEDRFLSSDYLTSDDSEWYRFFTAMGVRDELQLISYDEKLTIQHAIEYGFSQTYLTRPSPNGRRLADGYSGLKIITFLKHTGGNYKFARFFWSFVIEKMAPSNFRQSSTRVYWRSSYGTEIPHGDYIEWFVKHIPCIPTTSEKCELSTNTYLDVNDMKYLCGTYLPILDISTDEDLAKWISFFGFKTKLLLNDYLRLLDRIHKDEENLANNQDRIQSIYSHLLDDILSWSTDERKLISTKSKSLYLLTENNQWKLASDLCLYVDGSQVSSQLNEIIPCLKLNFPNQNHQNLRKFAELFAIKQIKIDDLKLVCKDANYAEDFRERLIEITPYLKNWLKFCSRSSVKSIDRIVQQEILFLESDRLKLYYDGHFIQETNAYFDPDCQKFYLTRPWHSETTLTSLPNKLCRLLGIKGFEKELRFLLKAERGEISRHFIKLSIEIPTDKDIVCLEFLPRSDVEIMVDLFRETILDQDESTSDEENSTSDPGELKTYTRESNINQREMYTKRVSTHSPDYYDPIQLSNRRKRKRSFTLNQSVDETFNPLDLIDLAAISNSRSASIKTPFNRSRSGGNGKIDKCTGLIGEQYVYEYLLNKYQHRLDSVSIEWLNKIQENSLPYDILLTKNGVKHYIEVKATRSKELFPNEGKERNLTDVDELLTIVNTNTSTSNSLLENFYEQLRKIIDGGKRRCEQDYLFELLTSQCFLRQDSTVTATSKELTTEYLITNEQLETTSFDSPPLNLEYWPNFLQNKLFSHFEDNLRLKNVFKDLQNAITFYGQSLLTVNAWVDDVRRAMRSPTTNESLNHHRKRLMEKLQFDENTVVEFASSLTLMTSGLAEWYWPSEGVRGVFRRNLNGKYRCYFEEDFLMAIFLEYLDLK